MLFDMDAGIVKLIAKWTQTAKEREDSSKE